MKIRILLGWACALTLILPPVYAVLEQEEIVVVMQQQSDINMLTQDQVINIFLGRFRQLPNGMEAHPIDQAENKQVKAQFYAKLINKSLTELQAYWARLVFSGKTTPPRQAQSMDALREWIREDPGAISYLNRSELTSDLKVVFSFSG